MPTDLSKYTKQNYDPGRNGLIRGLWYLCNHLIFSHAFLPFSGIKVVILRIFGARIGAGVNLKPNINIKYPWHLEIGNQVWIGEGVWIDNLVKVAIGDDVCISQGAMLLTGNHDFTKPSFDLITAGITLEQGVWIGAKALVGPGVLVKEHAVLCAGSVATKALAAYTVYQGNPAMPKKKRIIQ
jgi:putative colanic acid biosynthesis acetyltransferase WcaF